MLDFDYSILPSVYGKDGSLTLSPSQVKAWQSEVFKDLTKGASFEIMARMRCYAALNHLTLFESDLSWASPDPDFHSYRTDQKKFQELLKSVGHTMRPYQFYPILDNLFVLWDHGIASIGSMWITVASFSPKIFEAAVASGAQLGHTPQDNQIYSLILTSQGVKIQPIGRNKQIFLSSNYSPDVSQAFPLIAEGFHSPQPKGLLAIINGEAGTGKTHFIQSLINTGGGACFVLVSASDIRNLSSPNLLGPLLEFQQKLKTNTPMVLIVEDADECLVKRKDGNLSDISALLNLSDGILGKILNLRIICTTNLKKDEIDPAVRRGGRLLKYQEIGRLSVEQARAVYLREGGKDPNLITGPMTLGDTYQLALNPDWDGPTTPVSRKVGF